MTYETRFSGRLDATPGLALLIASLGRHMPDIPLFVLHTEPCDHLKNFAEEFGPSCVFKEVDPLVYRSFYGKPNAIIHVLELGFDRVCWIDSDIIIVKNCSDMLFPEESATLRTTQAPNTPYSMSECHVALFGTEPLFDLFTSISSGVISVTSCHRNILDKWKTLMEKNKTKIKKNSDLFRGDQEVLEASIMNLQDPEIEISPILNDRDHLTCDRSIGIKRSVRLMRMGVPPLIHSSPYKAWWPLDRPFEHGARAFLDCTPYVLEAKKYRQALQKLGGEIFLNWLFASTFRSKLCISLPPWKYTSPLFWYFISGKLFKETYEPSEAERDLAMSLETKRTTTGHE